MCTCSSEPSAAWCKTRDGIGHTLQMQEGLPAKTKFGSEASQAQECGTAGREKLATGPQVSKETSDKLFAEDDLQAVRSTLPMGLKVIDFTAVPTGRVKKDCGCDRITRLICASQKQNISALAHTPTIADPRREITAC